jgi:hypothetical protein
MQGSIPKTSWTIIGSVAAAMLVGIGLPFRILFFSDYIWIDAVMEALLLLLTSSPRNATAKATSYCDIFILQRSGFEKVLHRHPKFESQIKEITLKRSA